MCGICGFVTRSEKVPVDPAILDRMTELLHHRGPDAKGSFIGPGGVALGIRRLSIVDLETGDQPIPNEDGSVQVVCNGEIYNAPELQRDLELRGHRFRGHSDVEVIPHLYEELGPALLGRLRGMFALAIWDKRKRLLLLARDRLGLKPLYFANGRDGYLYFASEAKSIIGTNQVDPALDPRGLSEVIHFGSPLFSRTLFRGVQQLQPGEQLTYRHGKSTLSSYWDLDLGSAPRDDPLRSESDWVEAIREKFIEVVDIHLRGDVPVACWLSPGLDSSSVAALAARTQSEPLHTYSLGFEDPYYDEIQHQKTLADFPGFNLVGTRVLFPRDTLRMLPAMVWHNEQPLALQSAYHVLSSAMGGRVKVALTGQGSDELFGGYSWHTVDYRWRSTYGLPQPIRGLLAGLLPKNKTLDRHALSTPPQMRPSRYAHMLWSGWPGFRQLLVPDLAREAESPDSGDPDFVPPSGFQDWDRFRQMQYVEFKTRLASFINLGLDQSSMSGSVEPRLPFLDHEFVELCTRLPRRFRQRRIEKYIFRKAMEPFLPSEIVWREKRGLRSPNPVWDRGQGRPPSFAEELLSEEVVRDKGYFEPRAVAALRGREAGLGGPLTQVLGLHLWDELFVEGRSASSLVL